MCLALRNTTRRGRSGVPVIRLRSDRWRFLRVSSLLFLAIVLSVRLSAAASATTGGSGLAGLLLDHFLGVLHALALVRLGGAQLADLGRGLAQHVPVGRGEDD